METKNFITMLLIFLAASVNAQLPQDIRNTLHSKYPDGTIKKLKHKQMSYIATLTVKNQECKAVFDNNGNWVQTRENISIKSIPESVIMGFKKSKYSGWYIEEITKIDNPKGIFYKILLRNKYTFTGTDEDNLVYFNALGGIINTDSY